MPCAVVPLMTAALALFAVIDEDSKEKRKNGDIRRSTELVTGLGRTTNDGRGNSRPALTRISKKNVGWHVYYCIT